MDNREIVYNVVSNWNKLNEAKGKSNYLTVTENNRGNIYSIGVKYLNKREIIFFRIYTSKHATTSNEEVQLCCSELLNDIIMEGLHNQIEKWDKGILSRDEKNDCVVFNPMPNIPLSFITELKALAEKL